MENQSQPSDAPAIPQPPASAAVPQPPAAAVPPQAPFAGFNLAVQSFTCGCGNEYQIKLPYGAHFGVTCLQCRAYFDIDIPANDGAV